MKRIKFGNQQSHVAEEEQPIRKKRINWDRLVYLAILFAIVGSLVLYLVRNFYFITAPAQVVKESYAVLLPYDARIEEIMVMEDDSVTRGTPLLKFERDFRVSDNTLVNSTRSVEEWITKERFTAQRNIRVKQVEVEELNRRIAEIDEQIAQLELLVILDVSNATKIEQLKDEKSRLKSDIRVKEEEIKYWQKYLYELPQYKERYTTSLVEQLSANNQISVFNAPVSGTITNINYKQFELAYKGEIIMSVELDDAYVRAYIPQKEFGSIFEGDVVTVRFPDRSKGKGIVEKIYSSLEQLPPEYQDETRVTTRSFLAIVRPLNESQQKKWRINNHLGVEIRKRRFF